MGKRRRGAIALAALTMSAATGLAGAHQAADGHPRPHAASPPAARTAALGRSIEPTGAAGPVLNGSRPLARLSAPSLPGAGEDLVTAWSTAVVPAEVERFGPGGGPSVHRADLQAMLRADLQAMLPLVPAPLGPAAVSPAGPGPAAAVVVPGAPAGAPAVAVAAAMAAVAPGVAAAPPAVVTTPAEGTTTGPVLAVAGATPGPALVSHELAPGPVLPGGQVLAPAPTPQVTPAVLGGVAPAHDPSTTTGEVVTVDDALLPPPPPPPPPPAPAPPPAPVPEPVPSDEQLAGLRACEAGGDYGAVSAGGHYRGAYQFDVGTWNSVAGRWYPHLVGADPALVGPTEQDAMVRALYAERGWAPWPSCSWGL